MHCMGLQALVEGKSFKAISIPRIIDIRDVAKAHICAFETPSAKVCTALAAAENHTGQCLTVFMDEASIKLLFSCLAELLDSCFLPVKLNISTSRR